MDALEAVVIGAAAAAIGTVVAYKFINRQPEGGGSPRQIAVYSPTARGGVLAIQDVPPTDYFAAPVAQTNPNTEAAYNQHPIVYVPAFGPDELNAGAGEAVLTI